jgi:phosphatidylserine/phosphatidylglycerophosphate/cardiolipin synthase-like enzyme
MKLHTRPLRAALTEVVQSASEELVIAAPYIKQVEANWVCDQLNENRSVRHCRLRVLTDIRSDSILTGFLDLDALELFHKRHAHTQVVSLPRLHAKVYIADTCRALVTSANLTPAGLDHNFEYGVCLEDSALVRKVKSDLEAYAHLGNVLSNMELQSLLGVAQKLKNEYERLTKSTSHKLKADFNRTLHQAQTQFLSAQVGKRSAQSLFAEAILYALAQGPLTTEQLHPKVQTLLPDLCDDGVELIINGQRFGKRWKHGVRNAQQYLKRSGKIAVDGEKWIIVHPEKR